MSCSYRWFVKFRVIQGYDGEFDIGYGINVIFELFSSDNYELHSF